jgi:hypothetical protein
MDEHRKQPKKQKPDDKPAPEPRTSVPDPETLRELYDRVSFAC